jgi:hypothetical protein
MTHSIYRSHRTAAALIGAFTLATACRDVPAPADPIARPIAATASQRSTIYEPNFDRYTATVVVTMSGGGISQLPALPDRRVEYSVERLLERGDWTTTYDFGSVRQGGQLRRVPIRKVVAGIDGMKYYDHNGDIIPLGTRLTPMPNGDDFPRLPEARPRGMAAAGGNPRAWAANLVTSPAEGALRRAQIAQTFARAETRGRTVRYRKERDGIVTEIAIDTTRGTIEETRTSRRGGATASTRFEYQDIGSDRWLRVRAVQRQEDAAADRHPLTVEQVFVDQRFHRAEGR